MAFLLSFCCAAGWAQVETNHILLSQICIESAFGGGSSDEFVELYNPTSKDIDLRNEDYRLYRYTAAGSLAATTLYFNSVSSYRSNLFPTNTVIRAHEYYLVVNESASTNLLRLADAVVSSSKLGLALNNRIYLTRSNTIALGTVDMVGFSTAISWEGKGPVANPPTGGSVIRKARAFSTAETMTNGSDTNWASAFDSDNNSIDFLVLGKARPRNSQIRQNCYAEGSRISLLKTEVGAGSFYGMATNVPLLAFRYEESSNGYPLVGMRVGNAGTMSPHEITNIAIYLDFGTLGTYGTEDLLLGFLSYDGVSGWTNDSLSVTNGSDVLVCGRSSRSAEVGKTFKAFLPANSVRISSFERAPSEPITNTQFQTVVPEQDELLFSRNSVGPRQKEIGRTNLLFSFNLRSTKGPVRLGEIRLTNRGGLADSQVGQISLFRKMGASLTNWEPGDQFISLFTNSSQNIWRARPGGADISSYQPNTNYLVLLVTGKTFSNSLSVRFGIQKSNIIGTGTGKAPSILQTNEAIRTTNAKPPQPTGFAAQETNVSSVRFVWNPYPPLSDFDSFVVFYGTNIARMTNRFFIATNAATSALVAPVRAGKISYFKLVVRDKSGQFSTNRTSIQVRTRNDLAPPIFNAASVEHYVNMKVVHMKWSRAIDTNFSFPLYYKVDVADAPALLGSKPPALLTQLTNTSLSLPAGTFFVRIRAMDAYSNTSTNTSFFSVTLTDVTNLSKIYFYPNPLRLGEPLRFNNFPDDAVFEVMTLQGKRVLKTSEKFFNLPVTLSPGVYCIVIRSGNEKVMKRLVYLGWLE
jgi:hypothetical protein